MAKKYMVNKYQLKVATTALTSNFSLVFAGVNEKCKYQLKDATTALTSVFSLVFARLKDATTALASDFSPVFTKCSGVLLIAFIFTGCSIKPEPVYKEVLTPIRCQAKMPVKPVNDGSFEAHKNKMIYYLRCESTLKYCLGLSQLKGDKDAKH